MKEAQVCWGCRWDPSAASSLLTLTACFPWCCLTVAIITVLSAQWQPSRSLSLFLCWMLARPVCSQPALNNDRRGRGSLSPLSCSAAQSRGRTDAQFFFLRSSLHRVPSSLFLLLCWDALHHLLLLLVLLLGAPAVGRWCPTDGHTEGKLFASLWLADWLKRSGWTQTWHPTHEFFPS